jgi:hypothetical protein
MMILHDAAGPAVLAANVLSPSSLLSSWGRPDGSRSCSPRPGALARALGALIAPHLARSRFTSGSMPRRTGPLTPARA